MVEENVTSTDSESNTVPPSAMQVRVSMLQGEHTGQPIYSNFTSVQIGQGAVIVDFGFLDPHTIHALNQIAKSGEKTVGTVSAKMSCRLAISIDAANQLAQQLNQLLNKINTTQAPMQQTMTNHADKTVPDIATSQENNTPKSHSSSFRFPWSKKTH
ncbi:MAG: hypothetical protein DYH15_03110 [Nitrosomonas sp. PRO4]|nr:hypothetical protein [Nitrosomonas sp. PRO4]